MTNETGSHENSVIDTDAAIAAINAADAVSATTDADIPELPKEPAPPSFDDLGLHPDVKLALDDMGYFAPTPVQTAVFKPVSENKDLLVQSRTGTGKTTAFGLPIVNRLVPTHRQPQALILTPTRELALQVARELTNIGKHRGIVIEPIYGGAPIGKQIQNLRNGVHIVVGTPGRVLDHIGRRTLDCKAISTFVLDECDEMLSMGFLEDIERVVSYLPEKKQTLLFSATMPDEVQRYARRHMTAPEQISLSRDSMTVSDIHHAYYIVSGIARSRDLLKIIFAEEPESAIIFCNMRDETTMVAKFLQKQGLDAEPLSSDLSQADRERVMGRMKAKNLRFLCATDVAARGIDISNLSHVINYSVPESPEVYVHRTGRTGRAGKKGTALSLVGPRELGNFRYVRLTFGLKPEERLLPKDDIFIGKLKVPLPPVGTPQAPDPVQILIRGVTGTASELERQIFEKLLASQSGKRVLAMLVSEKLDKLSTKSRPKRTEAPREAAEGGDGEKSFDRGDRPERGGDRERRPYRGDGERSFDRDRGGRDRDRGERRPWRGDGERTEARPEGSERPERTDRPERGDRERRPWRDRDGEARTEGGERTERGDRPERGDRERRPWRDRDAERTDEKRDVTAAAAAPDEARTETIERDRGERRFERDRDRGRFRDRGERGDRGERPAREPERVVEPVTAAVGQDPTAEAEVAVDAAPTAELAPRTERDRHGRDRGERRDRGDRRDRRDRHARGTEPVETIAEVGTEAAPAVETVADVAEEAPTKVDDVAARAIERVERGDRDRKDKRGKKAEPTADTREFWETWAEEKSTREPAVVTPAAETAEADSTEETSERPARRERGGRDRDRGGRDKGRREAKAEPKAAAKPDDKAKKAAPVEAAGQARLFVSLGKKHGVSADDLRSLLAAPIGGDKERIGSVALRDSHAHVRVPEDLVEDIIAGVHGTTHNDHDVTVERARA